MAFSRDPFQHKNHLILTAQKRKAASAQMQLKNISNSKLPRVALSSAHAPTNYHYSPYTLYKATTAVSVLTQKVASSPQPQHLSITMAPGLAQLRGLELSPNSMAPFSS